MAGKPSPPSSIDAGVGSGSSITPSKEHAEPHSDARHLLDEAELLFRRGLVGQARRKVELAETAAWCADRAGRGGGRPARRRFLGLTRAGWAWAVGDVAWAATLVAVIVALIEDGPDWLWIVAAVLGLGPVAWVMWVLDGSHTEFPRRPPRDW